MYTINKIVGYLISPAGFGMALVAAAVLARVLGRRRLAGWAVLLALANFWIWATPWMTQRMGAALEAEFLVNGRVPKVESFPQADVIVLHGGGMGLATNIGYQAEMWSNADRVWHTARLWKAGKALKILVTSPHTDLTTGPLLADLGVPKDAIIYDFGPRNTEEEARAVERFSRKGRECCDRNICVHTATSSPDAELISVAVSDNAAPSVDLRQARSAEWTQSSLAQNSDLCVKPKPLRVLVVTSAWHMKRTMLMYQKYAPNVEAIPAPCDFENTLGADKLGGWASLLPAPEAFLGNSVAFHEWLGYWGYKWLR